MTFLVFSYSSLFDFFYQPGWLVDTEDLVGVANNLPIIAAIPFSFQFLRIREFFPRLYIGLAIAYTVPVIVALAEIAHIFPPSLKPLYDAMSVLVVVPFLAVAFYSFFVKNHRLAMYYIVGWGGFFASVAVYLLARYGYLERSTPILYAVLWGEMFEVAVLLLAVTGQIRETRELQLIADEKASQSERLKVLIRALTHDMRNPLTVIKSATGILERFVNGERGEQCLVKINKACDIQESIMDHVTQMQAVADGKKVMRLVPVNLRKACEDALSMFEHGIADKKLTIQRHFPKEDKDLWVKADQVGLTNQVIANILSNAIKFSHPSGSIAIDIKASKGMVMLRIGDHGIGMTREIRSTIFDSDKPSHRPGTSGEKGIGFGMNLAKVYIEAFGGYLKVRSQERSTLRASGTQVSIFLRRV
jgi:signal transduction histidine kinase